MRLPKSLIWQWVQLVFLLIATPVVASLLFKEGIGRHRPLEILAGVAISLLALIYWGVLLRYVISKTKQHPIGRMEEE